MLGPRKNPSLREELIQAQARIIRQLEILRDAYRVSRAPYTKGLKATLEAELAEINKALGELGTEDD